MPKKKRTNPRKIPISPSSDELITYDKAEMLQRASAGNSVYAWLLVLHTMLYQEAQSPGEVRQAWDAADAAPTRGVLKPSEMRRAEAITGLALPYPNLEAQPIRSKGDAIVFQKKARERALCLALFSISLGLADTKLYDETQLRRIFSNVDLTLAEIENGQNSYSRLMEDVDRSAENIGRKAKKRQLLDGAT